MVLKLEKKEGAFVLLSAAFLLLLARRSTPWGLLPSGFEVLEKTLEEPLYLLGLPLIAARFLLGERPSRLGLKAGSWEDWIATALGGGIGLFLLAAVLSRLNAYRVFYPALLAARKSAGFFWLWEFARLPALFASEFFFRGYLTHGLKGKAGTFAISIQAALFCLALGWQPGLQLLLNFPLALGLGWVSLRYGSVLPCFAIRFLYAFGLDLFCRFG